MDVSETKYRKWKDEKSQNKYYWQTDKLSQTQYHRRGPFWLGVNDRPPLLLLHISALRKWFLTSCTPKHPIKFGWPHSRYCVHRTYQQLLAILRPLYFSTIACNTSSILLFLENACNTSSTSNLCTFQQLIACNTSSIVLFDTSVLAFPSFSPPPTKD